ncbi:peptidoglycan recognition protein isoform X3 [Anabrus simplex]|uniref:peptidoglycan recognition protein isoform X3 n=1 Tax=Anabrus simplex TaxID=316456 RepID=UPI0035A26695
MSVLAEDCDSSGEEFEDAREEWYGDGVSVSGEVQICSELGLSEDSRVRAASESDSDSEEFVDAEDSVDVLPDMVQGCRIDKNVEKALDALLSFRGGRAITKEEIANMYTSRMVHVGNVKYDLTRINLSEHQRLLMSQQVRTSYQDTQDDSDELRIVTRDEWKAEPPMDILTPLKTPVPLVIICHTAGLLGFNQEENTHIIQRIQAFHTENLEWDDIGYNFLIGMDGLVYEGRGWLNMGAHTLGYNSLSIGVAFVGRFVHVIPSEAAMRAFHKLVAKGVQLGHIAPDYKLLGACQLRKTATDSPGKAFYDVIVGWPHWAPAP